MLARYAVAPSPSLASGPQLLLLCKLRCQLNYAESILLQVFFLKNLKPLGINTYEKQGEGSSLWLTSCYKKVSVRKVRWNPYLPSSVHSSTFRIPQILCLPLLCEFCIPNGSTGRKQPGRRGTLPILEQPSQCHPECSEGSAFSFLATRHSPLATFFPNAFSTGAEMISRTRSRNAGTSSLVSPLVSIVSCR